MRRTTVFELAEPPLPTALHSFSTAVSLDDSLEVEVEDEDDDELLWFESLDLDACSPLSLASPLLLASPVGGSSSVTTVLFLWPRPRPCPDPPRRPRPDGMELF